MAWTRHFRATALAALLAVTAAARAAALEPVEIAGAQPGTSLRAHLAMPAPSTAPVPGVVFLHGCSGLGRDGRIFASYRAWAAHMNAAGYAVLMVDSAGSRGLGSTCGPGEGRRRMYRERPGDAYAALAHLQSLPQIDPGRIALIGWSQGGAITLLSFAAVSAGRPSPPPAHDFRAAVAFYPGACSDTLQSRPYTSVEPGRWAPIGPLLVLQGGADNWTPAPPCVAFIEAVRARGHPAAIVVYPGALHSFDAPGLSVRERTDITTSRGEHPRIGTDEAARRDAFRRVLAFLEATTAPR